MRAGSDIQKNIRCMSLAKRPSLVPRLTTLWRYGQLECTQVLSLLL